MIRSTNPPADSPETAANCVKARRLWDALSVVRRAFDLRIALVLLGAAVVTAGTHAGEPTSKQDPQLARGEHLARLICTACHVVASNQEYPPLLADPAPAFADIAGRPGANAAALTSFINSTHWDEKTLPLRMPDQKLSKRDTQAVVAYILSLRKP